MWTTQGGVLIIALRDELLVRSSAVDGLTEGSVGSVDDLRTYAKPVSSLSASFAAGSRTGENGFPWPTQALAALATLDDVQVWAVTNSNYNSINLARYFNMVMASKPPLTSIPTQILGTVPVSAISPNHVFVPCSDYNSCPGGPPTPVPIPPPAPQFIPTAASSKVQVVAIDSGYIARNAALDQRLRPGYVSTLRGSPPGFTGYYLDVSSGSWDACPPDGLLPAFEFGNPALPGVAADGRVVPHVTVLDGVVGHGTFVAGLIAHNSAHAEITVVGERRVIGQLAPPHLTRTTVFADEMSIARSLLRYSTADVISCGFAFPPLDERASIPLTLAMGALAVVASPHVSGAVPIVVAPLGNEGTDTPYWPAAHADVVGVAATGRTQRQQALFTLPNNVVSGASNWVSPRWQAFGTIGVSPTRKCAARGVLVESTFITGPYHVEEFPRPTYLFRGWASWEGTSFAAPKVSAALAERIAAGVPSADAYSVPQNHGPLSLIQYLTAIHNVGTAVPITQGWSTLPALFLG